MIESVHIIKMGGTIEFLDSAYRVINDSALKLDTTLDAYFHNVVKTNFDWTATSIFAGDSKDINNNIMAKLIEAITNSPSENILITHGTDTMIQTARTLKEAHVGNNKIIVTGAMIPLVGFATSDAGFNLGFAIGSFPNTSPGVYIAAHGKLFDPNKTTKNFETLQFLDS